MCTIRGEADPGGREDTGRVRFIDVLSVEGRLHAVSALALLAAGGLLLFAARPPAFGRRLGWLYPSTVIVASLSSVPMMVVDLKLLDPLAAATLCLAVAVLAVAGRRRHAAVVAQSEAVHRRSGQRHER